MTTIEIREKLTKAQETVAKKEATLQKYNKKEEKLRNDIIANGWDPEAGRYQKEGTDEHNDCYWLFCDYEGCKSDIKRTEKVIEEKKEIVVKWEKKLAEATMKEKEEESLPEILKTFQLQVVKDWDEWDFRRREEINKIWDEYHELYGRNAYKEFFKKYKSSEYNLMHTSDEEIHKDNARNAKNLVLNLWNRVKDIVGEVTEYNELRIRQGNEWEGAVVNGFVEGTNGKALVETIGAGGYNIQKFHYRTLVKAI